MEKINSLTLGNIKIILLKVKIFQLIADNAIQVVINVPFIQLIPVIDKLVISVLLQSLLSKKIQPPIIELVLI